MQSNMPIKIRNVLKFASMFNEKGCADNILINEHDSRQRDRYWVCDSKSTVKPNQRNSNCSKCFVMAIPSVIELIEVAHMMEGEDGCYYIQSSQDTQG